MKFEIGKVYRKNNKINLLICGIDSNFIYAREVSYDCSIGEIFILIDVKRERKLIEYDDYKETSMESIKNDFLELN